MKWHKQGSHINTILSYIIPYSQHWSYYDAFNVLNGKKKLLVLLNVLAICVFFLNVFFASNHQKCPGFYRFLPLKRRWNADAAEGIAGPGDFIGFLAMLNHFPYEQTVLVPEEAEDEARRQQHSLLYRLYNI